MKLQVTSIWYFPDRSGKSRPQVVEVLEVDAGPPPVGHGHRRRRGERDRRHIALRKGIAIL